MAHLTFLTCSEAGRQFIPPLGAAAIRAACNRGEVAVAAQTLGGLRLIAPDEVRRVIQARRAAAIARDPASEISAKVLISQY